MTDPSNDFDWQRFESYQSAYRAGEPPPWDTGIVPPEVRALVDGPDARPPGRALDVGCGTGVSAVYLAAHGWQVTGVDFVPEAVARARARAAAAGLDEGRVRFQQSSVVAPDFLIGHPPVSLWLDIGCMHTFQREALSIYASHAARLVVPGGGLRLYAWRQFLRDGQWAGLDPAAVEALFAPDFVLEDLMLSDDTAVEGRPSAWYWLRRLTGDGASLTGRKAAAPG